MIAARNREEEKDDLKRWLTSAVLTQLSPATKHVETCLKPSALDDVWRIGFKVHSNSRLGHQVGVSGVR
jgi:hypothetical protein